MNPLFGSLNEALLFPHNERDSSHVEAWESGAGIRKSRLEAVQRGEGVRPLAPGSADILPFPYLSHLHSLVEKGRILEARNLLALADNFIPQDAKVREVLAPPRVRQGSMKGVDRAPEFSWLARNSAQYQDKWVALLGENLIAHSDTLKDLLAQLKLLKPAGTPLVHHIID